MRVGSCCKAAETRHLAAQQTLATTLAVPAGSMDTASQEGHEATGHEHASLSCASPAPALINLRAVAPWHGSPTSCNGARAAARPAGPDQRAHPPLALQHRAARPPTPAPAARSNPLGDPGACDPASALAAGGVPRLSPSREAAAPAVPDAEAAAARPRAARPAEYRGGRKAGQLRAWRRLAGGRRACGLIRGWQLRGTKQVRGEDEERAEAGQRLRRRRWRGESETQPPGHNMAGTGTVDCQMPCTTQ